MTSLLRYYFHILFALPFKRAMSVIVASTLHLFRLPSATNSSSTTNSNISTSTSKRKHPRHVVREVYEKSMEELAAEIRGRMAVPSEPRRLLGMSKRLVEEYEEKLRDCDISMLPSYQHTLPSGRENGDFLALDVGGSTFRLALIRLTGKKNGEEELQVRRVRSFSIDKRIRDLEGQAFFDWMAERIGEMLTQYNHLRGTSDAMLEMGLAWSFPIEQTSPRTGKLLAMGKGFCATCGVEGQDLSELIMRSCRARRLNVEMKAIVNDGAATLLAHAYRNPSTRMSLILGTGTNAAVVLPVTAVGGAKWGERPESWHAAAKHVVVNTELSMFGRTVWPRTRWDDELNRTHTMPDFQPLEYMVAGRYLGEIVRLILMEAITTAGLFNSYIPARLNEPYTLDARTLASFETDSSPTLSKACAAFLQAHPLPHHQPSLAELKFMREVILLTTDRAAAYLATALHALWTLRTSAEGLSPADVDRVAIACNGTIVEKYPQFRARCQQHLDGLCELSGASLKGRAGGSGSVVVLEMAPESSIFGAAVAASCVWDAEEEKHHSENGDGS